MKCERCKNEYSNIEMANSVTCKYCDDPNATIETVHAADDADKKLKWTLGRNNERRFEPIGDIWFVIVDPGDGTNPRCPQCGRNNAMLPEFGVNNLVCCRDCRFLCRLIDEFENEERRASRRQVLENRAAAALAIVREALPDVPAVMLDRVFDMLLQDGDPAAAFDKYVRTIRKKDQEFAKIDKPTPADPADEVNEWIAYRGRVVANEGTNLTGGVKSVESSLFWKRSDAQAWNDAVKESNPGRVRLDRVITVNLSGTGIDRNHIL